MLPKRPNLPVEMFRKGIQYLNVRAPGVHAFWRLAGFLLAELRRQNGTCKMLEWQYALQTGVVKRPCALHVAFLGGHFVRDTKRTLPSRLVCS